MPDLEAADEAMPDIGPGYEWYRELADFWPAAEAAAGGAT